MLRNLSVGKKIGFSVGALVLILVLIVTMSGINIIIQTGALERTARLNQMQEASNLMLFTLGEARQQAAAVFSSAESEENYRSCIRFLDECREHLDEMAALAVETDIYPREDLGVLREQILQWRDTVDEAYRNNRIMEENTRLILEATDDLADITVELNFAVYDAIDTLDNALGALPLSIAFSSTAQALRNQCAYVVLGMRPEAAEEVRQSFSALSAQVQPLQANLVTELSHQRMMRVQTQMALFEETFEAFHRSLEAVRGSVTAADAVMEEIVLHIQEVNSRAQAAINAFTRESMETARVAAMTVLLELAAAVALAVAVTVYLTRAITRPLHKAQIILTQVGGTGSLKLEPEFKAAVEADSHCRDEIGRSIQASMLLVRRIQYLSDCLEQIADGNFSLDVALLSDRDSMGRSINRMLGNFNAMLAQINRASIRVANGSGQVAAGADNLARGVSDQSATVRQIASSISSIYAQAEQCAAVAKGRVAESAAIEREVSEGNEKMRELTDAVQTISQASSAIEQVIKDIESIAFQTNILALNASVEAARAGVHGKGFAVIADEVQTLAARSAEAAQKSAVLIIDNMEKSEQGLRITRETAASLDRIFAGIQRAGLSLQEIAFQAQGISEKTREVNESVGAISTVVSHNSAASEESAAVSGEISGQAEVLQRLLAHFKLRPSHEETGLPSPAGKPGSPEPALPGVSPG